MVKPEWGAKHGCPKCGTRFYDLGKDDPVTCIECGHAWTPEPVLKSKQPIPYEEVQQKPEVVAEKEKAAKAKALKAAKPKYKRGRPRKGEVRPPPEPAPLERQRTQTLPQMMAEPSDGMFSMPSMSSLSPGCIVPVT